MFEKLKSHWQAVTVAIAVLTVVVPMWLSVFQLREGQDDLKKQIDARWTTDISFNKQWQEQDRQDEAALQNLLNDVKDGHTDIKEGMARVLIWLEDNSDEHNWLFNSYLKCLPAGEAP